MHKANDNLLSAETFSKHDSGMAIIQCLVARAPIREGEQFYNLYKGSECLTYSMLSGNISSLGLEDGATVQFAVETEPKF